MCSDYVQGLASLVDANPMCVPQCMGPVSHHQSAWGCPLSSAGCSANAACLPICARNKAQTQIPGLRSLSHLAQEKRARSQFLPAVNRPVLHMREHCPVSQHCLQDNHGKACIWNEGLSIVQDSAITCRQELYVGATLLHRTAQPSVGRELGLQYKLHICSPVRDKQPRPELASACRWWSCPRC